MKVTRLGTAWDNQFLDGTSTGITPTDHDADDDIPQPLQRI